MTTVALITHGVRLEFRMSLEDQELLRQVLDPQDFNEALAAVRFEQLQMRIARGLQEQIERRILNTICGC